MMHSCLIQLLIQSGSKIIGYILGSDMCLKQFGFQSSLNLRKKKLMQVCQKLQFHKCPLEAVSESK